MLSSVLLALSCVVEMAAFLIPLEHVFVNRAAGNFTPRMLTEGPCRQLQLGMEFRFPCGGLATVTTSLFIGVVFVVRAMFHVVRESFSILFVQVAH